MSPLSELSHIYAVHRISVTYDCVRTVSFVCEVSHIRMSLIVHVNGSCRTYEDVMHINASCCVYEWVMSHMCAVREWVMSHIWRRHAYEWMRHVAYMNESCRICTQCTGFKATLPELELTEQVRMCQNCFHARKVFFVCIIIYIFVIYIYKYMHIYTCTCTYVIYIYTYTYRYANT